MMYYAVAKIVLSDHAPKGMEPYITEGKSYPMIESDRHGFTTLDDDGEVICCLWQGCGHQVVWERANA